MSRESTTAHARDTFAAIDRTGIVAIVRGAWLDRIDEAVTALVEGGVCAIEVSLVSAGAEAMIGRLAKLTDRGVVAGAGTVMSVADVERVAALGARFVVSPHLDVRVVDAAARLGLVTLPGAFTPTEIVQAMAAGADGVKLFPADTLGAAFVRAVRGPLPDVRLVPTGGVTLDLATSFIAAGAWALGVGGPLLGGRPPASDADLAALSTRARAFIAAARPSSHP